VFGDAGTEVAEIDIIPICETSIGPFAYVSPVNGMVFVQSLSITDEMRAQIVSRHPSLEEKKQVVEKPKIHAVAAAGSEAPPPPPSPPTVVFETIAGVALSSRQADMYTSLEGSITSMSSHYIR
jgi:hypothetical protein